MGRVAWNGQDANVFLSKYHLRDSYVIAEDQLFKFRTSRKIKPIEHTNISRCQLLLMQTLSAILGVNFWDLQYLFHFEKSYCKGVCVSTSAIEIVCLLIFQVTALDLLYNFKHAIRISMLLNNLAKICHIAAILKMATILNILLVYFDCSFFGNHLDKFWTSNIKHDDANKQSSKTYATWRPFWKWQPSWIFSKFEYCICLSNYHTSSV